LREPSSDYLAGLLASLDFLAMSFFNSGDAELQMEIDFTQDMMKIIAKCDFDITIACADESTPRPMPWLMANPSAPA
jgi:hypothetical protein